MFEFGEHRSGVGKIGKRPVVATRAVPPPHREDIGVFVGRVDCRLIDPFEVLQQRPVGCSEHRGRSVSREAEGPQRRHMGDGLSFEFGLLAWLGSIDRDDVYSHGDNGSGGRREIGV